MIIRPETIDDIEAIFHLTQAAFATMPYSDGSEGPIINHLRKDGHLLLSLVVDHEGEIVGQISFSPIALNGEMDGLYGLGPVSAHPDRQKQGIGSALIQEGISRLRDAKAIFLIGDPNYYSRFNFIGDCGLTYGEVPPEYVQGLFLDDNSRTGELQYVPAFDTN
ncbi:MAG: N-acetyltransferase [Pseudomonadota bacterium]